MSAAVSDRPFDRDRDENDRSRSTRWGSCFALIAALHLVGIWAVLHVHAPAAPRLARPPATVMIELPPMPAARLARPREIPPPKHVVSKPPPPRPVAQPVMPQAPRAPVAHVDVPVPPRAKARPLERTVVADRPKPVPDDNPPAPVAAGPQPVEAPPAPAVAAPVAASAAPAAAPPSNAVPTWQGVLLGRLERFKRYPGTAQLRHQQGVVYLRFAIDRRGKVVSASIDKSSGFDVLDQETLALIHRAEPFPPPPPEMAGDPIELVVPVQFFLKL